MNNYTPPREFTADEDALVRQWVDGIARCKDVAAAVGCSMPTIRFRARRLGWTTPKALPVHDKPDAMPRPADPFIPIAHKSGRYWFPYVGAPVTVDDAQRMVAAGIATTAQKKIDGGWDLMFKVLK
jgi:hypothetical protein